MTGEIMETTIAEKFAIVSVLATAILAAGSWVRVANAEWRADRMLGTVYSQPLPSFQRAVAAGYDDINPELTPVEQEPN
jgi:hypothetical protein